MHGTDGGDDQRGARPHVVASSRWVLGSGSGLAWLQGSDGKPAGSPSLVICSGDLRPSDSLGALSTAFEAAEQLDSGPSSLQPYAL